MLTENADGQVSLFAVATASGKMSPERTAQTAEKTSKPSSRSLSGSRSRMPQRFLYLRRENGRHGTLSWETDGALLGGRTTRSIGEFRSVESGYVCSLTSMDGRQEIFSLRLNTSEKPYRTIPSKLSEILETAPDRKYDLSPRACQGILNRADRRGKELPETLKNALIAQSACKETVSTEPTPPDATGADGDGGGATLLTQSTDRLSMPESDATVYCIDQQGGKGSANYEQDKSPTLLSDSHGTPHATVYSFDSLSSNSMKSSNPDSGCRKVDISKTLDCFDPNPSKNQGGIAIVEKYDQEPPCTLKIRGGCEGGGKGPLVQVDKSATLSTLQDQTLFVPQVANTLTRRYDGSPQLDRQNGANVVVTAGFSMGNSDKARSIGYQEEVSPTLRGGEGGNQKPCIVCGNPWDAQSERVYHGDGAWHSLNANESGGQSRDAILAFSQNQREEVRTLGDCAGSVVAEPGTHQQTFVMEQNDGNGEDISP